MPLNDILQNYRASWEDDITVYMIWDYTGIECFYFFVLFLWNLDKYKNTPTNFQKM